MNTTSNRLTGLALALALLSGSAIVMPTAAEAGFWGNLKDAAVGTVTGLPKTAKDAAKQAAKDFRDLGKEIKDTAVDFGKGMPRTAKDAGKQLGRDIVGGIKGLGLGVDLDRPGVPLDRVPPSSKTPRPRGTDALGSSKIGATKIGSAANRPNERVTVAKKTPPSKLPPRRVSNQAPDRKDPGNLSNKMRDKRLGISINDVKPSKKLTRDRKIEKSGKIGRIDKRNLRKFDRGMKFKNQFRSDRRMNLRIGNKRGSFKQFRQFRRDRQNFRVSNRSRR